MNFRIYYDGGETYAGEPYDAPGLGVLVIVERSEEHGRRLVAQGDYYIWNLNRWWAVDFMGLVDYLIQPGPRKVIIGRKVPNEVFYAAVKQANEDKDFPVRTAWENGEERPND